MRVNKNVKKTIDLSLNALIRTKYTYFIQSMRAYIRYWLKNKKKTDLCESIQKKQYIV